LGCFAQVRRPGLQFQLADDQFIQAFFAEHDRHFVDRFDVLRRDDGVLLHVAEHGDLGFHFRRDVPVGAAQ
jgi:hypothetical protein